MTHDGISMGAVELAAILRAGPMSADDLASRVRRPIEDVYAELVALEARTQVRVIVDRPSRNAQPVRRWELMA